MLFRFWCVSFSCRNVCVYFTVVKEEIVLKRMAGCESVLCVIPASTEHPPPPVLSACLLIS
jgi:hypothetical protein